MSLPPPVFFSEPGHHGSCSIFIALLTARFLTVMDFHFDQSSAMGQAVPSWPIALDATENRAEAEGFDDESDDDEAGGGPGRSRRVERNAREQRRSNRITGQ